MLDVLIALVPAAGGGVFTFGPRALVHIAISVVSCVFFEWLYCRIAKRPNPIGDCSAAVTGFLLALTVPVAAPVWMTAVGGAFAIIIVKQLYGGLGKNVFNPAVAAYVFLLLSWSSNMTAWTPPRAALPWFTNVTADTVTAIHPLAAVNSGGNLVSPDMWGLFIGQICGSIGETSALALLIGAAYLIFRRVISPRIPAAFAGTVAIAALLFPKGGEGWDFMTYSLLSGGLLIGAFFMATDPATSPVSPTGQWVYGAGCGLITVFIRYFGVHTEGVAFAILTMNAFTWMIDKGFRPRRFGVQPFFRRKRSDNGGGS